MPKFTSEGHNTRNFGISTAAAVTAQWNTLNGMRVPKANKVCYPLITPPDTRADRYTRTLELLCNFAPALDIARPFYKRPLIGRA